MLIFASRELTLARRRKAQPCRITRRAHIGVQTMIRIRILRLLAITVGSFLVYLLSYAPLLRCCAPHDPVSGSFYYRSPVAYRPVEWLTLNTELRQPLLVWARLCGSNDAAHLQTWFFGQQIEDPGEMSVSWMNPD